MPRTLLALLDRSHPVYWQCCVDTVQLVLDRPRNRVTVKTGRGVSSGDVTFMIEKHGGEYTVTKDTAGTAGDRGVGSCVTKHVVGGHCWCAPPLPPTLSPTLSMPVPRVTLTKEVLTQCQRWLTSPYTQDHMWMMHMLLCYAHEPEQEETIASLALQCLHPLETRYSHLLTMASLLLNTLHHLTTPVAMVRLLVQQWALVARSYVCPTCTHKGVSALPSHVLARKRPASNHTNSHMAMVSVTCAHCYRESVVCIFTPARIALTSGWWRTSKWKWRTTSWTPPLPAAGGGARCDT